MDKEQALHHFWSQFGVPAFDQNTVPDEKDFEDMGLSPYPRITYEVGVDNIEAQRILNASIWDRSSSWSGVTQICHRVEATLGLGGQTIPYEGGMLWVKRGMPFAQRMGDTDDSIRRIALNIEVEFISEV